MDNLPTFPGLLSGVSNRFAFAAFTAVVHAPGRIYNPLWVYGPSGTGKTTLLRTALRQMQEHRPELRVRCIEAVEYVQKLVSAIEKNTQAEFRAWLSDTDVLAVDHAEYLLGKNYTQLTMARDLARLADLGCQVLLISASPAEDLEELNGCLQNCCEWFLKADIQAPTDGERLVMAQQTARELDLPLSETLIQRIIRAAGTHCHVRTILNQLAARRQLLGPDAGELSEMLDAILKKEAAA